VLVWINGPFGVGKTTAAQQIRERDARWRIFEPESVGYMLRANLAEVTLDDFQDLPAWRTLVPVVAHELTKHVPRALVDTCDQRSVRPPVPRGARGHRRGARPHVSKRSRGLLAA
jgi:hypothetical protein